MGRRFSASPKQLSSTAYRRKPKPNTNGETNVEDKDFKTKC